MRIRCRLFCKLLCFFFPACSSFHHETLSAKCHGAARSLLGVTPMGRPLRRQPPGQPYLVTTRCHQARFFLRPDPELNRAVLEWLARAQGRFPDLRILAVSVLSNHLHLVVCDETGELAAWASYFFGNLARAVNHIRGRSGSCFERRYSAEPILDDESLLDRLIYVVANPVSAGLCRRARRWPGVVLYAADGSPQEIRVSWIDRDARRIAQRRIAQRRAAQRGRLSRASNASRVEGRLVIDPIPPIEVDGRGTDVSGAIEARERELADERRRTRRKTLTIAQVLAQDCATS